MRVTADFPILPSIRLRLLFYAQSHNAHMYFKNGER